VISPTQGPLHDNTQHFHETDIHADTHLRPRGVKWIVILFCFPNSRLLQTNSMFSFLQFSSDYWNWNLNKVQRLKFLDFKQFEFYWYRNNDVLFVGLVKYTCVTFKLKLYTNQIFTYKVIKNFNRRSIYNTTEIPRRTFHGKSSNDLISDHIISRDIFITAFSIIIVIIIIIIINCKWVYTR